jgi:hypothetical protein
MRLNRMGGAALALFVALTSAVAAATADDKPDIVKMIFEHKHLSNVEPGASVAYRFNRLVSNAEMLGQPFSDDITLKVVADKPTGKKDVDLQIYTGDRARDLQKLPDLSINPVFLVYFNQAVNSFSQLAGGQRPYLTRVFSTGFKDKAKIEPVKVEYKGKQIDAYRITMAPYAGDVNESKMQGWENAEYELVLSDQVPGEIIDLIAKYKNKYPGKDLALVERITLDGATGLEKVEAK